MTQTLTMIEKAELAWGAGLPDWVRELAALADRDGLRGCEKRIGYSTAAISQAIGNKYRGDIDKVADKVRGALMGETVTCPVQGKIARNVCLDWQGKPRAVTNPFRTKVYRACRNGCPHSRLKNTGGNDA
ncbi:transcriptional regulator [Roseibium sp. MB-4]|jgi:hypothetical protein